MASISRREFLAASAACATLAASRSALASPSRGQLRKAVIGVPDEALLQACREAGLDGIESSDRTASPQKAEAAGKRAEKLGLKIHGVLYGWADFNRPDTVAPTIAAIKTALEACRAYGGDTLLLVPCRIGSPATPAAWEFDIRFDEPSGHLRQVVAGDNQRYAEYIRAHNAATDASRDAVRRLIPLAEKAGVIIALENVWNNLWVQPKLFARFVASLDSPWVRAYFDIGNHVKYAAPEEWIRVLGKRIVKCHAKDFKLNADGRDGQFCNLGEGSVSWPKVLAELHRIGYEGWVTVEAGGTPAEQARRLKAVLASA